MEEVTVQDALDVLSLAPDFDMEALKRSYRTVALRVHPDRGGSPELFSTVNECFRVLMLEHNSRTGSALHDQLKRDFEADVRTYDAAGRRDVKFNLQHFNEVFDKTKVFDGDRDSGYGSWLQDEAPAARQPKLNPNAGSAAFNRAFEASVPAPENAERAVVVRPIDMSCGSSLWLTELGGEAIDDYSRGDGYDCRLAHSTQRLADPRGAMYSADARRMTPAQVEAQRSADMAHGLTLDEQQALERERQREARVDAARRETEALRVGRMAEAHAAANRIMLGPRQGI